MEGVGDQRRGGVDPAGHNREQNAHRVGVAHGFAVDLGRHHGGGDILGRRPTAQENEVEQRRPQVADPFQRREPTRRLGRSEDELVQWTGKPLPLVGLQAHQHHGDDGGDGVGQIEHQIDLAGREVLLDPFRRDGTDDGEPARCLRRGEPGQEEASVGMEGGAVYLRGYAPVPALRGNGDAAELLAQPGSVEVVLGRERLGVAAASTYEVVRRDDPVAAVGRCV